MADAEHPQKPGTHCPSCGRFVGAREVCPYCGASIPRRLSVRLFKYGAVALAVVGLLVLWAAATFAQVPLVYVGDIVGTMNWAYVRLEGVVTRMPTYDEETGYLSFWLYDDTGDIMVSAYRTEAQALVAAGKDKLVKGARVRVTDKVEVYQGDLEVMASFSLVQSSDKARIPAPTQAVGGRPTAGLPAWTTTPLAS